MLESGRMTRKQRQRLTPPVLTLRVKDNNKACAASDFNAIRQLKKNY